MRSASGLFLDLAGGDYRLAPKSPARDRARAKGSPPVDFADRPRPAGAGHARETDEQEQGG